ncbi:hypothetical protein BASA81_007140 [Batrachochytrium salamandrivorans]|nr:hypothetical protein BASA81_007140 [Batrachochytrium salamandrivorans]
MLIRRLATSKSPIKQFWKQIEACTTALELEQVLVSPTSQSNLNDVNLAKAVTRLGELESSNHRVVDLMFDRASHVKFKPGELMDLCLASSQLDRKIPEFVTKQIADHTAIAHFKPKFFSFILYSYFELKQTDARIMHALGWGLVTKPDLSMFGLDDFAIILDSLHAMGYAELYLVGERISQELLSRPLLPDDVDTADLTLILTSLRAVGFASLELLTKLQPEIESRLDLFSPVELKLLLAAVEDIHPELDFLLTEEVARLGER